MELNPYEPPQSIEPIDNIIDQEKPRLVWSGSYSRLALAVGIMALLVFAALLLS